MNPQFELVIINNATTDLVVVENTMVEGISNVELVPLVIHSKGQQRYIFKCAILRNPVLNGSIKFRLRGVDFNPPVEFIVYFQYLNNKWEVGAIPSPLSISTLYQHFTLDDTTFREGDKFSMAVDFDEIKINR